MKAKLTFYVLLLAVLAGLNPARAQSTAFTYQGRLNFNGAPVNGAYDFQFAIYDASVGGNLLAGPLSINAVNVVNGLFVARLDFGVGVFTGPPRWLQVSSGPAGAGNPITLDRRLELTSSPYSIRALAAGTADKIAPGTVVTSLNGLHDDLTLATDPTLLLSKSGNTLTLSVPGGTGGGFWSLAGSNLFYNAGNVGIGSSNPVHRLSISGGSSWTANGWAGAVALDSGAALGWKANAAGQRFGLGHTDNGFFMFRTASDPGTTGSAATYDFALDDSGRGSFPGGLNLGGQWDGSQGAVTLTAEKPTIRFTGGVAAFNTSWLLHLGSDGPGDLQFFAQGGVGPAAFAPVMSLTPYGSVGIGTTTPQAMLDIVGQNAIGIYGYQPYVTLHDTEQGLDVKTEIQNARGEFFFATDGYLNGSSPNGYAQLHTSGNLSVATLTIRGGADLAEPFEVSSGQVTKGAVMVIDPENPGHLKPSEREYDRRVAGVVSGAGGLSAGISLHHEGVLDGTENIALSGRVYVLADAATGPIEPGDLLTTSSTPGHAMRATDSARAQGAILGKAMTGLKTGHGLVLVLVTLQ